MIEPLPQDPLGQRLCQIFGRYRWMCIEASTNGANKPRWRTTDNYPLRPRSLWARWQDDSRLVGVRFDDVTDYFLLDIDAGGSYCSAKEINNIRGALETVGIVRTIPLRSSWSGGIHLYCPLPETVKTFDLACTIKHCLESQGFKLADGHLEVFPNVKAYGKGWLNKFTEYNAHRLPLQPGSGSAILDHNFQPISSDLERFFWHWDFAAQCQDMDMLHEALPIGRDSNRAKSRRQSQHPVEEWRIDLETEIEEGWTGHGQTNRLLKTIACKGVVFERLAGEDLADYVLETAIALPGYTHWCRHQHEIHTKAAVWARAAEKYYWPLGSGAIVREPLPNQNEQRATDAQKRIKQAVAQLQKLGRWPARICDRIKELFAIARVSSRTLYKNLTLWHPDHMERCKNPDTEEVSADSTASTVESPDQLRSHPQQGFLHLGGKYEGCSLEDWLLKTHSQRGREGVEGERGELSTGLDGPDFSTGGAL